MLLSSFEHDQDEEAPKQKNISTQDVDRFVQMLKQNESFNKYLFSFFHQNAEVPQPAQNNQENAEPPEQQKETKKKRSKSITSVLTGITSSGSKDTLEEDLYSIMMITEALSLEWILGFLSFSMQVTLAGIIIHEQIQTDSFGSDMSIPINVPPLTRVTQVLSVILALMTQNEFLSGLRTIFMFPFENKQKWGKICDIENYDYTMWLLRVLLPNAMKSIQGSMILVASFIVIVQLTSTVEVLKDYSALFVVSSVDNFFFDFADEGYFGKKVRLNAEKVKDKEFEETEIDNWLRGLFLILIGIFLSAWVSIFVKQEQGVYVKQAYPLCDHNAIFNDTEQTFLSIIGDTRCQFPQGEGTNIIECGWDGGDCEVINERFPRCTVNDFTLLGDGKCQTGIYNSKACGFDNGDCFYINALKEENYPDCKVTNIGWIGDGICNGGEYTSDECENDGGDCSNCIVHDINLVGDGTCDDSTYNNEGCSFDGGDCTKFNEKKQKRYPNCNVRNIGWIGDDSCDDSAYNTEGCSFDGGDCTKFNEEKQERYPNCNMINIGWIGDGICNGGEYTSDECENDGEDCANCAVDDINLVGDGTCNDSAYNNKACSFDGGDCTKFNEEKQERYPNCNVTNIGWVGDGICNDENNIDGCLLDGNDCVPSMKVIGDKYKGMRKYKKGVLGHDGNIYGIPFYANRMLRINPSTNTAITTDLVGDDIGDEDRNWYGGVVGTNGIIYGVPNVAKFIMSYNPTTEETQLIAEGHPLLESARYKFTGGVLAKNGMIYFIPRDYNKVIKFDPSNLEDPLTEVGDDLGDGSNKMFGGVLGSDGNIYGIPSYGNRVLKIDVTDDTTSFIGVKYQDGRNWEDGILAQDGNIYACPFQTNQILQINIESQTTNLVGPDLGDDLNKWSGFVEGEDGFLYGIPYDSEKLLRFDPINHTATLIPIPEEILGKGAWWGGVRAENGFIYAFPCWEDQVLSIAPLKIRP